MEPFVIKQHDTQPALEAVLSVDDVAITIPEGAEVTFTMRPRATRCAPATGTPKVEAAAEVVDGDTGTVRYNWASADTDTEGSFDGEFKVSIAGAVTTYPSTGYIPISIVKDLS